MNANRHRTTKMSNHRGRGWEKTPLSAYHESLFAGVIFVP